MKPHYLNITSAASQSFSARRDVEPDVNNHWHYHDELELIYIKKGSGTQFIGDSIQAFSGGTVALIGSNLPHYWQFDDSYFTDDNAGEVEVYVVHFKKDFLGKDFLQLPENTDLKKVIEAAARGIQVTEDSATIAALIAACVNQTGTHRIITLLQALLAIGITERKPLVSIGFKADFQETEKNRLQKVYNYSISHYRRKIELQEVAKLAQLTESAFCKFFKSKTGKTYTVFVNEIRIGHACRLLIENRLSIKEICFECGFYNAASFHKCFKDVMKMTPLQYQKNYV
ncbi:transcriptional regulator [Flavobacterium akiainvivens]|uniref:Transcriptional regulator n=1 Tax=Flavobacterium akiainvivens TaxID=1202724 RepID=A0A0M8M8H4_9FLAO|nr:AraC family transcriptional regulator [Flavobacterium akiainvivens]KOS05723.1 transcriptional regulator [Flavobacterium akiainvivens]SFQ37348.1 AraC-type DNA-binding protein [Flavobacterium akiainvivens]